MLKTQTSRSVPGQTFDGMHFAARERDINKGGLYDARSGAINIWCSTEDKSVGYGYEIRKGELNYLRDYIATIMPGREESENHGISPEL